MIVRRLVIRSNLAVVCPDRCYVVSHDIDHDPDALGVCSVNKRLELRSSSKIAIDRIPVLCPVAMVSLRIVINHRTDPYGVEAHTLDIGQVVLNAGKCTATVVREIGAGGCRAT